MAAVATRSALAKRDLFTRGAEIVLAKPMALALSDESEKIRIDMCLDPIGAAEHAGAIEMQ